MLIYFILCYWINSSWKFADMNWGVIKNYSRCLYPATLSTDFSLISPENHTKKLALIYFLMAHSQAISPKPTIIITKIWHRDLMTENILIAGNQIIERVCSEINKFFFLSIIACKKYISKIQLNVYWNIIERDVINIWISYGQKTYHLFRYWRHNLTSTPGSYLNDVTSVKRFELSISDSSNFELAWLLKALA